MNRIFSLSLLAAVLVSGVARGQIIRPLSLEDALSVGRQNSRTLRIAGAKADAAAARAAEAGTALLPSVKADAGYRRLSDAGGFEVTLPFLQQPVSIAPSILNTYSARVTVQQPLFTGFRLQNASRALERLADAGAEEYRMEEADLTMDICAAYWALFQAIRMERFAEENVLRLESYRDDTHRLVEAGLATRNDELKIEVQLGNARLLRIDAQNETRVTRMALNMTLGLPLETPTDPSSDPDSYIFPGPGGGRLKEVDSLVALAGAARPDLRATHLRLQAAEASVAAARGAWWPQVVLSGGYAYQRPNARYQPPRDEFKSSWDIGIGVQLDVWNWGATGHQTEQAEAALRQAELVLGQMQENVNFEVRRAVLSLGRAGDKSEVARLSLRQAEENLRMTNDRYRSGLATSTDLLDASVALMQAQTSLSGAQVELALADARLGRALGQAGRGGRQTEGKTGK